MKTKAFNPVIRLLTAVVITLLSLSSVSCDKDENNPSKLVGLWERAWDERGTTVTESYWFDEEGWGDYYINGKSGYFYYTIESPGYIRFNITYRKWIGGNGSYKDEFVWSYSIKGDKLILDGKTYTLKSREITVYSMPY